MVVDNLRARFNTPHRKLFLQSEVNSLNFDVLVVRNQIQDEKGCFLPMVEYLKNITVQLLDGFYTKRNKMRYLRSDILGKKWAITTLKNMSTAQYSFEKLVMALNGSIKLEHEIEKAGTSSKT